MQVDMALITYATLTLINAYWTWQGKRLQNRDETIKMLHEQLALKDITLGEMVKRKNELKYQYNNLLAENKRLHGENTTYRKFHGHKIDNQ